MHKQIENQCKAFHQADFFTAVAQIVAPKLLDVVPRLDLKRGDLKFLLIRFGL